MINPSFKEYLPSYYVSTANPHPSYPTLEGRLKTETCVIGGGLSGLCTALPLAENGHEVIVLEAARIGFGASGRSGGQVISDFACGMEEIEKQVGLEQAQWFWQQSLQAVELVDSRIQKHNIQCDWQRGYATVAVRPQHWEELQQWHEHAQKHYGASHYQLWDKATLKQQLASDMYQGAQFDPLSGHLHPLNYTLGIAKAAADAEAQLFEQSPMTRIEPCDNGWLVHTPNGSVKCKNLVYAVNTYAGLHPKFKVLEQKAIAVSTFIIATEPLGERAKDLIRNNMAICDNRHVLDYYRLSADGRLLFGGKDNEFIDDPDRMTELVRQDMLKVFPQLADVRIEHSWAANATLRATSPTFRPPRPTVFYAQGYSGHGMAITGIAGLAIAEAIMGDDGRLKPFEQLRHSNIITQPFLRKLGSFLGSKYYQWKDSH
ncbi:FAD-binding oxidoreductase [Neisseria subflava]|uniref:FAD-binding oxidoreductase n=1 Tax=Neisseria subflava TaxID=28449 RepID=A0A9X9I4F6_NEISU|nr:FAD-binding oxidoreductase [Neisseria subflava]